MNAKNACLTYLVALVVIGAILYALFWRESPAPQFLPAAGGAFVLTLGLMFLHGALHYRGELALVRRSLSFEPFQDGERIAAAGPVRPLGDPLESPISRGRCVAYEYEVFRWVRRGKSTTKMKAFWGLALTPSAIDTPRGRVALYAWPNLDFKESQLSGPHNYENARRYVDATDFKPVVGVASIKDAIGELRDLLADDDGRIRKDMASDSKETDLRVYLLSEKRLEEDEEIVAFGQYSTSRGGLVPEPGTLTPGITIMRGDADHVLRKIGRRMIGNLAAGIILGGGGIAAVMYYLRWLESTG